MARVNKYTIKDLKRDFRTDHVCLDFIFQSRHSQQCSCGGVYKRIKERKQYQCSKCRFQIAPLVDTIFEKSTTSLTEWFFALFIFSNAKSGISAKELERQLGVTYKTAWRMLKQIRSILHQDTTKLKGNVETDGTFFGGHFRSGKYNKHQKTAFRAKSKVMGAITRGGEARVKVVPNHSSLVHKAFLERHVSTDSRLLTDGGNHGSIYKKSAAQYFRQSVNHSQGEYVRGDVHVNNMEVMWGHIKRSLKGTHKAVSKHYLQSYLDSFVFHYNNRDNDKKRFSSLLDVVLHAQAN